MTNGATVLREAGQGRNPAALSDVNCVLFFRTFKKPFNINTLRGFCLSCVRKRGRRGAEFKILSCLTC